MRKSLVSRDGEEPRNNYVPNPACRARHMNLQEDLLSAIFGLVWSDIRRHTSHQTPVMATKDRRECDGIASAIAIIEHNIRDVDVR